MKQPCTLDEAALFRTFFFGEGIDVARKNAKAFRRQLRESEAMATDEPKKEPLDFTELAKLNHAVCEKLRAMAKDPEA